MFSFWPGQGLRLDPHIAGAAEVTFNAGFVGPCWDAISAQPDASFAAALVDAAFKAHVGHVPHSSTQTDPHVGVSHFGLFMATKGGIVLRWGYNSSGKVDRWTYGGCASRW